MTDREKRVLKAIQSDAKARGDFDFLCRKTGCNVALLTTYFVVEAWLPTSDDWLTRHQVRELKSLAVRITDLARKIQHTNDLTNYRFAFPRIDLVDRDHLRLEADFRRLPELLTLYSRNLQLKVETEASFKRIGPTRKELQLETSEQLLAWIKKTAGKEYRDRVASVQQIVYREAGLNLPPASGETLRKRAFRKRKRSNLQTLR